MGYRVFLPGPVVVSVAGVRMKRETQTGVRLNLFDIPVELHRRLVLDVDEHGDVHGVLPIDGSGTIPDCPTIGFEFLLDNSVPGICRLQEAWHSLLTDAIAENAVKEVDHAGEFGRWSLVFIPIQGVRRVQILIEDHSSLDRISERLRVAETVFQRSPSGIYVTDTTPTILYCNEAVSAITGFSPAELIGKNPKIFRSEKHPRDFYQKAWNTLMEDGYWEGEFWGKRKGGMVFPQWVILMAVRNAEGRPVRLINIFRDITRNKQQEEFMQYLARQDVLTGLPHRNHFGRMLNTAIRKVPDESGSPGVGILDLDDFNLINRTHGYRFGDQLLRKVAERLVELDDTRVALGRLGGDEFGFLLADAASEDELVELAKRILKLFERPFLTDRGALYVSAAAGLACYPHHGKRGETLLRHAEEAMRSIKSTGGDRWRVFSDHMITPIADQLQLKNDLHRAVHQNEFELYYQPRVDLNNREVQGAECLIRWRHPKSGRIMPDMFIPLAEDCDLILPIGGWVMETVANQLKAWIEEKLPIHVLSFNVSGRQLYRGDLVGQVREILRKTGVPPGQLEVELTESTVLDDLDHAVRILSELRALGVRIALDDFGTGYSSLNYLRLLPLDTLKIERSFVKDVMTGVGSRAVLRTLFQLGRDLGMRTVAEGVETVEQLEFLEESGCDEAQGFLIAHPLPGPEFRTFVNRFDPAQLRTRS